MTAKEYLGQAYKLDLRINGKLEQLESLRSLTQKVTVSFDRQPVSHTRNVSSLEDTILHLIEVENEINTSIDTLVDLKMEIVGSIAGVENLDYQILLEKRYICFHSWEEIASELQCTIRWVHELHKRALQAFQLLLDENEVPNSSRNMDDFMEVHRNALASQGNT
jgi:hypothetical protein